METNRLPELHKETAEFGCCPKFDPAAWDGLELHFEDKPFVRCKTRSVFYVPLDMGRVFKRTFEAIKAAGADEAEFVVMSDDSSRWRGEHYFNVKHAVPGADNVRLTGDYLTRVYEGPFRDAVRWVDDMRALVAARGRTMARLFFYYTTCPKCARLYGKNYVVGIVELG